MEGVSAWEWGKTMIGVLFAAWLGPVTGAPPPAAGEVAFCFVRDAPHHDFLTPPAPAGTELDQRMREWLAATMPSLSAERLANDVQCDPGLPRAMYDGWMGWTKLSDGDVLSEPLKWPADWYLHSPPRPTRR